MSKVRTTVALSEANHRWLKSKAPNIGEMSEFIEGAIQKERLLTPVEDRLSNLIDRLADIMKENKL